jgi:coenzyme Q-binding protein COQ10
MTSFSTVRSVRHSADAMFALVADVERYPEFVPFCRDLTVRERSLENGDESVVADMTVSFKVYSETIATKSVFHPEARTISIGYLGGPFRSMQGLWTFVPTGPESCDVGFGVDYEMKSRLLGAVVGMAFEGAFKVLSAAFEKRADVLGRTLGTGV